MTPLAPLAPVGAGRAIGGSGSRADAQAASHAASTTSHPASTASGEAASVTRLSALGQLIEDLLSQPEPRHPGALQTPALVAAAPGASAPAEGLATALAQAIEQSGLFYEAHLGQWLAGSRDLASLRDEPQGRLDAASQAALPVVDQPVGVLVQQQLQALDTGIIDWQGMVWPEQAMQWTIATQNDPDQDARSQGGDNAPGWCSTLRLTLPELGEIEAEVQLTLRPAMTCSVLLQAASGRHARLRAGLASLAAALDAAGLPAGALRVALPRNAATADTEGAS